MDKDVKVDVQCAHQNISMALKLEDATYEIKGRTLEAIEGVYLSLVGKNVDEYVSIAKTSFW